MTASEFIACRLPPEMIQCFVMGYPSGDISKAVRCANTGRFFKIVVVKNGSMVYNMLNKRANG